MNTMTTSPTGSESSKGPRKLSSTKRWCDPEQFKMKYNMQTKSTANINNCTRDDTVYRYYEDTDTLSVYFAKASSGVVSHCKEANENILVSYDRDDKIVSVEIYDASEILCCHLFDDQATVDNKPPLSFYPIYYKDCDELKVFLINSKVSSITFQKTDEKDFEVGINDDEKIVELLFRNVSSRIAKTLPEEDRKKLEEEAKIRSLKIAKWSYLLD